MTVTSIRDAWAEVRKIFPTDYEYSIERSERAGYPIYYSKASGVNAWISDLGNRLEINLPDGESANIWIQAPGGGHHQQQHQEHRGNRGYRERHQGGAAGNRKADSAPCVLLHRGLCPRDGQQKARGRRSERNAGCRNGGRGNQVSTTMCRLRPFGFPVYSTFFCGIGGLYALRVNNCVAWTGVSPCVSHFSLSCLHYIISFAIGTASEL